MNDRLAESDKSRSLDRGAFDMDQALMAVAGWTFSVNAQ
jgi:hypothetical protein